ncbi:MAG TPA: ABC transporter permease [Longimicrobium sp.]|jgi:phospholipid/cholesterol/gamma-HCH transport system permease protein|uniref:MlaE family ABC transporter permease n=1 Tax=Longimicrobium sp. TaxID=2029185 RepID=UPI002EDB6332
MQTSREEPAPGAGTAVLEKARQRRAPRPHSWPERRLASAGRSAERLLEHAGGMATLVWRTLVYLFTGRIPFREFANQVYWMGVGSIPIVMVTGSLAGVVTSQQGGYQFTGNMPLEYLGSVVASSIILELGPVLTAVVLIGRVGARITAELGTMRVSEQIDALYSLGRDPVRTLVAPRIVAGIISVPILVAIANLVGLYAGMMAAQFTVGLGRQSFFYGASLFWHDWDMFYSLSKALAFGFVIPLVACHMGLATRGGAEGVGRYTTAAVVTMTLGVLILDALFPPLLLN